MEALFTRLQQDRSGELTRVAQHQCLTSFSITAMRLPWLLVSMLFNRVVLPEPRNPVMTCEKAGRRQICERARSAVQ